MSELGGSMLGSYGSLFADGAGTGIAAAGTAAAGTAGGMTTGCTACPADGVSGQ